jgi:putative DNA primase/helicase
MHKIDLTKVEAIDVTSESEIVTPMPEPVVIPKKLKDSMGEPEAIWIYRMADGAAFGAVARWNPEGKRKQIRPIVWNGKEHVPSGFGDKRPLYNSDLLAAAPVCPVLIVEGEKAANAAQEYVSDGWVVTTWQGGANAVDRADWSALTGHTCVIWPDNDGPGISAGDAIRKHLSRYNVASTLIGIPSSFPDGWDLADELPPKITKAMVNQLLRRSLRDADVVTENVVALKPKQIETKDIEGDDPDCAPTRRWRPIGYDNQIYYLMNDEAEQIWQFTASKLMTEVGMREIVNDVDYWIEEQRGGKRVNWTEAGANVMKQCVAAGVYNPDRVRGRGVWMDKDVAGTDRVILHSGETLFLTRQNQETKQIPFARIKSRWYYKRTRPILTDHGDGIDYLTQATDEEGLEIREMLKLLRWQSPVHADLLAGWVATAIVCGALPWRTHCWITGNQGSGKSTVVDKLIGALFGDIALYPLGTTTEAGLRQAIGSDARPVIFDESEGDKHKEERRQAIIQLMRQASSDTRGLIMKGGANHESKSFTMRSAFLMSSIGVGLKEAADLTRTAVLTLKPNEACSVDEMRQMEQQFQQLQTSIYMIRPDMPQRLLARQMSNIWALKQNIEVFKEVIATSLSNRRVGDQLGTLLAGAYSLSSRNIITRKACQKYLDSYDWSEFTSVTSVREDIALMHHICGYLLRVETRNGTQERAIGELLWGLLNPTQDPDVMPQRAADTLGRYGIKIDDSRLGIWIATNVATLNKVMASSVYAEGWLKVLQRNPACKRGEKSYRFGGEVSRAIYLPVNVWPISERAIDDEEGQE